MSNKVQSICEVCALPILWEAKGNDFGPGIEHHWLCIPEMCADCGKPQRFGQMCDCWIAVEDVPLADLKGLLARDGISVNLTPEDTDRDRW